MIWRAACLLLAGVVGQAAAACQELPLAFEAQMPSDAGAQKATAAPEVRANIVDFGVARPFEIHIRVCGSSNDEAELALIDALMPAHQHGMNYDPTPVRTGPGAWVVSGMVFHMPGAWRIEATFRSGGEDFRYHLPFDAR